MTDFSKWRAPHFDSSHSAIIPGWSATLTLSRLWKGSRQRAFSQPFGQGFAFEVFHHQVIGAVLGADVVEMADVGMVQRGNGAGLALHALLQFGRRRKTGGKNFHRHGAIKAGVAGTVNLSHAA